MILNWLQIWVPQWPLKNIEPQHHTTVCLCQTRKWVTSRGGIRVGTSTTRTARGQAYGLKNVNGNGTIRGWRQQGSGPYPDKNASIIGHGGRAQQAVKSAFQVNNLRCISSLPWPSPLCKNTKTKLEVCK
jgi:hypothetical protein